MAKDIEGYQLICGVEFLTLNILFNCCIVIDFVHHYFTLFSICVVPI